MVLGGVCYSGNVANHNGREIDLFPSVHQVNETLIYSVYQIAPLTYGNDILDDKPKKQLM